MRILRVTQPFADFVHGDEITDPALVERYHESHRGYVVPVNVVDPEPAAAEAAQPKPKSKAKAASPAAAPAPAAPVSAPEPAAAPEPAPAAVQA